MARPRTYPVIDGKKECSQCHTSKPLAEFGKSAKASDGHQAECRDCHKRRMQPIYPRDEGIVEQVCSQCGTRQMADEFYDNPYVKSGLRAECRTCTKANNAEWNRENPDKRKPIANRSAKKTRGIPDKRASIYAKARAWQLAHPEAVKAHRTRERARAKEKPMRMAKKRAGTRRWFQGRPGYRAAASHKRRAMLKNATIVDALIYTAVLYTRDKGICTLCRYPVDDSLKWPDLRIPTVDHFIPVTLGGEHSYRNTKLAHHCCNTLKNNRLETPEILAACRREYERKYLRPEPQLSLL